MKRFLSLFLALTLICTMLPIAFASDETSDGELEFIFSAASHGSESELNRDTLKEYDSAETPKWATVNTQPWRIDGIRYVDELYLSTETQKTMTNSQYESLGWRSWKKRAWAETKDSSENITGGEAKQNAAVAILIDIKKTGSFVPSITFGKNNRGCILEVYLVPKDDVDSSSYFFDLSSDNGNGNVKLTQYLESIKKNEENYSKYFIGKIDGYADSAEKKTQDLSEYKIEETGEYYLLFWTNGVNEAFQKIPESSGNKTYTNLYSFTLTPKAVDVEKEFDYTEEKHIGGSASVKAYAVYGTDEEVKETEIIETPDVTYGETCKVTAPEAPEGYSFLYWAKGATMAKKQIVSYSKSFDYKPSEGANYLIAVYKKNGAEAVTKNEYYNANGQLLTDNTLPSMAGYGKAKEWKEYGNGIFVAQYDDLKKDIAVTVDGKTDYYAYGDTVTCTASAPEGKQFKYWVKDGEIVSLNSTYCFNAWKMCTIEAVYGETAPSLSRTMRKIILDTFTAGEETAIMAEFIGFKDALEKGIMFGNQKIAMKSDKTQFTVMNDEDGQTTVKGYAIVKVGDELKIITDAEIVVGE